MLGSRRIILFLLLFTLAPVQASTETNPWKALSFPVEQFVRVSSPFGWRTNAMGGNGTEFHAGLDLKAPEGANVRAWAAGMVTEAAFEHGCGWHIIINSSPWTHTYCHLSLMGVQVGDTVQTGQIIGAVGATGRATGPHLHWALRYNGELVDPYPVLLQMQQAWQE